MTGGYAGRILEVNLSNERLSIRKLDEETRRKYIGGVGLAAKMLWDETKTNTEPLSSENLLIFMTGPLTGTPMPSCSRYIVSGISPLTGIWGEAHSGGDWGDELKHAGFDGVVVRGKSKKHVYIWIHDGEAEIRDASHVWGEDTYKVEASLRRETDEKASVAAIGRGGERLVRFAGIVNDGKKGRVAARCGLGAVMGFKRVKAIVVRGDTKIHVHDVEKFGASARKLYDSIRAEKHEERIDRYIRVFRGILDAGGAPIKNWREGTFEAGYKLAKELQKTKSLFCRHCPTSCTESNLTEEGQRHMVWQAWGPMGTQCLIDNAEALQEAYMLCNKYGLDTISTGGVISFAMELMENGLITKEDTGEVDLTWGNHEALVQMVEEIGEREGFGKLLGEGVKRIAECIGGIANEYAVHVKGLELPAHDPRASSAYALNYAVSNLGAAHFAEGGYIAAALEDYYKLSTFTAPDLGYTTRLSRFEPKGKGELVAKSQNFGCMVDSSVVCDFMILYNHLQPSHFAELIKYATGWDMNPKEFMKAGERIFNLKRVFNIRRGMSRKDDTLPTRILTHKRNGGAAAENLPFLGLMLNEYYSSRGWSEEGIPTKEKLMELNLRECLFYGK